MHNFKQIMRIFLKGVLEDTFDVDATQTIGSFRATLPAIDIRPEHVSIVKNGIILHDHKSFFECGIRNKGTIYLTVSKLHCVVCGIWVSEKTIKFTPRHEILEMTRENVLAQRIDMSHKHEEAELNVVPDLVGIPIMTLDSSRCYINQVISYLQISAVSVGRPDMSVGDFSIWLLHQFVQSVAIGETPVDTASIHTLASIRRLLVSLFNQSRSSFSPTIDPRQFHHPSTLFCFNDLAKTMINSNLQGGDLDQLRLTLILISRTMKVMLTERLMDGQIKEKPIRVGPEAIIYEHQKVMVRCTEEMKVLSILGSILSLDVDQTQSALARMIPRGTFSVSEYNWSQVTGFSAWIASILSMPVEIVNLIMDLLEPSTEHKFYELMMNTSLHLIGNGGELSSLLPWYPDFKGPLPVLPPFEQLVGDAKTLGEWTKAQSLAGKAVNARHNKLTKLKKESKR